MPVFSLRSKRSRTKSFSVFWPRVNWSDSKNSTKFLLSLQFTRSQNTENALHTAGTQGNPFCEHGDLSFLLYFSKQSLIDNTFGKF